MISVPARRTPLVWKRHALLPLSALSIIPLIAVPLPKLLLWNASASVPEGLYVIDRTRRPTVGQLAVARLPDAARELAATRHYLPADVPLIKPVAARAGDTVCRQGLHVSINGLPTASALDRDRFGRPLPTWSGCKALGPSDVFLMNPAVRDSFDGRYFGPIDRRRIDGRALPVLTRTNPGAALHWHLFSTTS